MNLDNFIYSDFTFKSILENLPLLSIQAFLFFHLLCFLMTGVNMSSVDRLVCRFNMAD